MNVFFGWVPRLWRWLIEPRLFWLLFCCSVIPLLAMFAIGGEFGVRLAGCGFQLMGIYTVAVGVSKTRAQFGHPTPMAKVASYLRRFPRLRQHVIVGTATCTLDAVLCNARGRVRDPAGPSLTLDARVLALESNLSRVDDELAQAVKQIEENQRTTRTALRDEVQSRTTADEIIRKFLENTATGGLDITLAGAIWLGVGVVLTTFPIEIANCH